MSRVGGAGRAPQLTALAEAPGEHPTMCDGGGIGLTWRTITLQSVE
jgi:hypothetical protein